MKIEGYSISGPIKGICKSHGVWVREGSTVTPIVYLLKPKWLADDEFLKIVKSIRLDLPAGYEIRQAQNLELGDRTC